GQAEEELQQEIRPIPNLDCDIEEKMWLSAFEKRFIGKETKQVKKVYLFQIRVFCYQSPITSLKCLLKFKEHCNEWQQLENQTDCHMNNKEILRENRRKNDISLFQPTRHTFDLCLPTS
ncbi:unnamed protein product, partial [Owenia fusiformis]